MTLWDNIKKKIEKDFEEYPETFLKRPSIVRALHPKEDAVARGYISEIPENTITDPDFGKPYISVDGKSSVSIQQMYYIHLMKKYWGKNAFENIIEIGGGYGNGCRIWKAFGHDGDYTIADFPELHKLQKAYIENTSNLDKVHFKSLVDCWDIPGGLLQATFSMNEMPLSDRTWIEDNINKYEYIFIAHNSSFDGVDNMAYFEKLSNKLKENYNVKHFKCHIRGRVFYLLAEKV